ncbi:MAG: serine hydrolase, partial [Dehalococcoidia bacterium]
PTPTPTATSAPALVRPTAVAAPTATPCDAPLRYRPPAAVPDWPEGGARGLALDRELQGILEEMVPSDGSASVVVVDVTRGRRAAIAADRAWYPASLYKLPILVEAFWQEEQGLLDPDRTITIGDHYWDNDLGTLEWLELDRCADISVTEAVTYMAIASDNAMAHMVRDLVGGANVDQHLEALGLEHTTVNTELSTSAADLALLLDAVTRGYPSPFVSQSTQTLLLNQWVRHRIPAGIDDEAAAVGNKTGDWEGAVHDVAVVHTANGTFVLAILTDGSHPTEFFVEVTRAVHGYLEASWLGGTPAPTPSAPATATPATATPAGGVPAP